MRVCVSVYVLMKYGRCFTVIACLSELHWSDADVDIFFCCFTNVLSDIIFFFSPPKCRCAVACALSIVFRQSQKHEKAANEKQKIKILLGGDKKKSLNDEHNKWACR